ncbi:hypothetical protein JXA56_02035 [Candidatus Micrarchaeota archaeon]|nr:hypothetical protein [Candidatus Micrarchaeota archaeon]
MAEQKIDVDEVKNGLYNMVEAMLKMGGGEELMMKTELLMLGIRQSKKLEPHDTQKFYDLLVLSYIGPQGDAPNLDKKLMDGISTKFIQGTTERVILETDRDDRYAEFAKKCLINAAKHGNDITRKYAAIALGAFTNDVHIRNSLVDIVEKETGAAAEGAEAGLRAIKIRTERETADADRAMLVETEYPDPKMVQRQFIDNIFRAVNAIYGGTVTGTAGRINVITLATQGTSIPVKLDAHSIRLVKRNVEGALISAFINGDEAVRNEAIEGIKKMGSVRILENLEDITKTERDSAGSLNPLGRKAREIAEGIQRTRYGKTLPPPLSRRKAASRHDARLTQQS